MNIFFLDKDPVQCAQWMVDKHVVKMIVETAQLLSTTHRVLDGEFIIEQKRKNGFLTIIEMIFCIKLHTLITHQQFGPDNQ